ncbi:MAG TPA: hypothetical protein VM266_17130 [Solirubrobacteraceae bacterium]|nr:hypothetical protein [Solirubrobacteraceae bacterium]
MSVLERLAAELRAEGGLLAEAAVDPSPGADAGHGEEAASGPRAAAAPAEYALLVEAIREGYLAHYGEPRVLRTDDRDLALLAGDHLYALGLERLAALGDLHAVRALADVIAACARAAAEERPQDAEAAWRRGVRSVAGTDRARS